MPSPITVTFTDNSWKEVKEYINETDALQELKPVIKRKDCNQSLTLCDALKVSSRVFKINCIVEC